MRLVRPVRPLEIPIRPSLELVSASSSAPRPAQAQNLQRSLYPCPEASDQLDGIKQIGTRSGTLFPDGLGAAPARAVTHPELHAT
ncbi:MAG: hypothetical protein ACT4TC_00280 [Myxococcaceae bacterium]